MKLLSILAALVLVGSVDLHDQNHGNELFIVLTTSDTETQMMAMVLATQSVNQGVTVRILLCGEAGNLAIEKFSSPAFAPSNRSPKQLLAGLIELGITVEVCGIFLPNRDLTTTDLIPGVSAASPPEVAAYMKQGHVRYFTF
jgi:predicted peroxiredoxin